MAIPFLLALLFLPQNKPPEKCSLSGIVVDSATGEPLGKVTLSLLPIGGEVAVPTANTDAKGRFSLVNLDPGSYLLRGVRSSYLDTYYGASRPGARGTTIRLQPGQALADLQFKLTAGGAIAGVIRDSDAELLEDAHVELSRMAYSNRGIPHLERAGSAYSDDRGEYRFHGLSPGRYYVSVGGTFSYWSSGEAASAAAAPKETNILTFYPGAPDPATAFPVEVASGARTSGIDITLLRRPVVCVAGRVAFPSSGRLYVGLESRTDSIRSFDKSTAGDSTSGSFRFCGVPPGAYTLTAYHNHLAAVLPLNVAASDIEDLRLTLSPQATLQGRISYEGPDKPDFRSFYIPFTLDGQEKFSVNADRDSFTMPDLLPGRYDVELKSAPKDFYLKSVRSGDTDVLADGLNVAASGVVPVELLFSPDGATAAGLVLDKDQHPTAGITVLLAPDDRARRDLFKTTTTDQRGYYEFPMSAPGKYKLYAWQDVEPNAWFDPTFLDRFKKSAEPVTLSAHQQANANLQVQEPPQ